MLKQIRESFRKLYKFSVASLVIARHLFENVSIIQNANGTGLQYKNLSIWMSGKDVVIGSAGHLFMEADALHAVHINHYSDTALEYLKFISCLEDLLITVIKIEQQSAAPEKLLTSFKEYNFDMQAKSNVY